MDCLTKPTTIDDFENIDFIFAIDENGTSHLNKLNENNKLFTVTGVKYNVHDYELIDEWINQIKNTFWSNGLFNNQKVVFHSKDIRKKQGPFNPKLINYPLFSSQISSLLQELPIEIYSASIDKEAHCSKYSTPYPVYELGVEFILERFCFDLRRKNKTGIILLESRGHREDVQVLRKITKLLEKGNSYHSDDNFSVIKGVYFNPKRTKDNLNSYWLLEIADIVSYRIHSQVKTNNFNNEFNAISDKIFGYPNYVGKGLKLFP